MGLIRSLQRKGYQVVILAPKDNFVSLLEENGCLFHHVPMSNKGMNPFREVATFFALLRAYRRYQPEVILHFTIKPNIYGTLVGRFLRIPSVCNVTGLGISFEKDSFLLRLIKELYRLAFRHAEMVFFQNQDDRDLFIEEKLIKEEHTDRLPGSGVDLTQFSPKTKEDAVGKHPLFLLTARMLWSKGVGEYIQAAKIVKREVPDVSFALLGALDCDNPDAISRSRMEQWVNTGLVEYWGTTDNVAEAYAKADCVVLPSYYREGVPRSLLEAAAMGTPIITTDSIGCKDAVEDGVTGYLCRPRDGKDLANKLLLFLHLDQNSRLEMGKAGRIKMEREFDEQIVVRKYLEILETLSSSSG